jgi:RNA polymerase sigma-70 factor (ECF subfamily)
MNAENNSFAEVYDAHAEEIYDFLYYKTFDRYAAEDLTSTTFMKALEHFPRFQKEQGASVKSWLYRIARNCAIDYYRTQKKDLHIDESWDIATKGSLSEETETKIALEKILTELQKLPEQDRELLILRLWQGLSFKEISVIMEKSEASLKMASSRALQKLKKSLPLLSLILFSLLWPHP